MKLYFVVGSGNCRKVLATINQLKLDVQMEYLDFFEGELKQPEYLALNPNGMVPTLRDGDFVLWESNAIMQYLADKSPGNTLFPNDAQTRADIVRWQCWELAHYNNAFGTLAWEAVAKPEFLNEEPNPPIVEWSKSHLQRYASVLENHLQDRDFVVGDGVTLADYAIISTEQFKDAIPFDWTPFPKLNAYYDRMRADPHWAETMPPSPEAIGRRPKAA